MELVEKYQRMARKRKSIGFLLLIVAFISLLSCSFCPYPLTTLLSLCCVVSLIIGVVLITCVKVAWRKYNGNYIILYADAIKKYLIINGEIECVGGLYQYDYYGQLPDGTEIYARVSPWNGSVKFSIGATTNHNISYL